MTNDKAATDDDGHRLAAEEIGMMTDQFNFNAFVAAEIAKVETGPTHKFDVACRIQEAANYLRLNSCKALQSEIAGLRSTVTAPELVEDMIWMTGMERNANTEKVLDRLAHWIAALTAHEPKVCEWGFRKFNSTLDPNIYINCKNEPIVAMYYDLSAKPYCPYCGGVIKVKE